MRIVGRVPYSFGHHGDQVHLVPSNFVFEQCVDQMRKVHETTTLLLVTVPNIHRF